MNLLKSIFIPAMIIFSVAAVGYAGWQIVHSAAPLSWFGVLATVLPLMATLAYFVVLQNTPRTSRFFPVQTAITVAGTAVAIYGSIASGMGFAPIFLAVGGVASFLLYVFWYSHLDRTPSSYLAVGKNLPFFELRRSDGTIVTSQEIASTPAVIMFYRGNWCPLCMAQIKELAGRYNDLETAGVKVALVSPQPHGNTVELAQRFGVKFEFMTDEGNAVARSLGIAAANGVPFGLQATGYDSETVLPTVVIIAAGGRILWTHETDNYRVRPEPDVFFDVLRANSQIS